MSTNPQLYKKYIPMGIEPFTTLLTPQWGLGKITNCLVEYLLSKIYNWNKANYRVFADEGAKLNTL